MSLGMARKLRVQYPAAIYHVMNRGDHSEAVFRDAHDPGLFWPPWPRRLAKRIGRPTAPASCTEKKAHRLLTPEMQRRGRDAGERKRDPRKIEIGRRLRAETTMTLAWIAHDRSMGAAGSLANSSGKMKICDCAEPRPLRTSQLTARRFLFIILSRTSRSAFMAFGNNDLRIRDINRQFPCWFCDNYMRFNALDGGFKSATAAYISHCGAVGTVRSLVCDPDGRVVVCGEFTAYRIEGAAGTEPFSKGRIARVVGLW
jgi:hypothetical protein